MGRGFHFICCKYALDYGTFKKIPRSSARKYIVFFFLFLLPIYFNLFCLLNCTLHSQNIVSYMRYGKQFPF